MQKFHSKDVKYRRQIEELGFNEKTIPAIVLLPLFYVAWADGSIQRTEAKLIKKFAKQRGLLTGEPAAMINQWMKKRPDDLFFRAGLNLLLKLAQERNSQAEIKTLIDMSAAVAKAAGGLFGFAFSFNKKEQEALAELENILLVPDSQSLLMLLSDLEEYGQQ